MRDHWKIEVLRAGFRKALSLSTYRNRPLAFAAVCAVGLVFFVGADGRGETAENNIAAGKSARQSSNPFGGEASRAVDGNTSGNWGDNTVTHTNNIGDEWWEVDLGASYEIDQIRIWNRTDCCPERLDNFVVYISEYSLDWSDIRAEAWKFEGGQSARENNIDVGTRGRYVRIQVKDQYLSLAEVEVLADESSREDAKADPFGVNIARGKTVSQSSNSSGGEAARAVDGNTSGNWGDNSVTHTNNIGEEWWEVDLGASYEIDRVRLWNRTDCCPERLDNFVLFISELSLVREKARSEAWKHEAGATTRDNQVLAGQRGRYIRVMVKDQYLSLAEAEVFAKEDSRQDPKPEPIGVLSIVEGDGQKVRLDGDASFANQSYVGAAYFKPLSVKIADDDGNPLPDVKVTFTTEKPSTMACQMSDGGKQTLTTPTNSEGIATLDGYDKSGVKYSSKCVYEIGNVSVTAKAEGADPITFNLEVRDQRAPRDDVKLELLDGDPQEIHQESVLPGEEVPAVKFAPLKVKLTDDDGNPAKGEWVNFEIVQIESPYLVAALSKSGSDNKKTALMKRAAASDANGVVTSSDVMASRWTGNFTVRASYGDHSVDFNLTVLAPPEIDYARLITIVDGDNQEISAGMGEEYFKPLSVKVTDEQGDPVKDARVAFKVNYDASNIRCRVLVSGALDRAVLNTNSDGIATLVSGYDAERAISCAWGTGDIGVRIHTLGADPVDFKLKVAD